MGDWEDSLVKDDIPWKRGERYATCGETASAGVRNLTVTYYEVPEPEARELWEQTDGDMYHTKMIEAQIQMDIVEEENIRLKERIKALEEENNKKIVMLEMKYER